MGHLRCRLLWGKLQKLDLKLRKGGAEGGAAGRWKVARNAGDKSGRKVDRRRAEGGRKAERKVERNAGGKAGRGGKAERNAGGKGRRGGRTAECWRETGERRDGKACKKNGKRLLFAVSG